MKNKNILISGASIAGPALAFWLKRYGFNPTLVEKSPSLREGGYKIDVRGSAVQVVKRMGIYDTIQKQSTDIIAGSLVNDVGKSVLDLPLELIGMRDPED